MTTLPDVLAEGLAGKLFSGAAYLVGTTEGVLEAWRIGTTQRGGDVPVSEGTLWDIASLTKPIVALQAMVFVEAGELGLDDPISRFLAPYRNSDKEAVTVSQLLTHTSGIPGQQPLYRTAATGPALLDAVRALPLRFPPGSEVEYTSQGFMVVGEILESLAAERLDAVLDGGVLKALGMSSTMFCPPAASEPRCAATEHCPWRGRLVKGSVHDENAAVLGGIAGHAGLFSTVGDMSRLGRAMLDRGRLDGRLVIGDEMFAAMVKPCTDHLSLRRCLGWQGADRQGCPVGPQASTSSFGHTGFTGTSLWVDPQRGLYVVLLTNAVHPHRRPEGLRDFRARFHNAVFGSGQWS